jgi:23S rRNA-/tRNA-specific pseudouridylate synthase
LDRETSGLLIIGLSRAGYDGVRRQFEERTIRKFYWAIAAKAPKQPDGLIDRPLAETDPKQPGEKKLARIAPVGRGGKPAQTAFRVLSGSERGALLECRPLTGRLHQVRLHLASMGCPVLGDGLYAPGGVAAAAPRLALHAHRLVFEHPRSGARMDVLSSGMPRELKGVLKRFGLTLPGTGGVSTKAASEDSEGSSGEGVDTDRNES